MLRKLKMLIWGPILFVLALLFKLYLKLARNRDVEEIEDEARNEVDAVPDGQPMADYINDRLRDRAEHK